MTSTDHKSKSNKSVKIKVDDRHKVLRDLGFTFGASGGICL